MVAVGQFERGGVGGGAAGGRGGDGSGIKEVLGRQKTKAKH